MNTNPNITLRSHPGTATRLDAGGAAGTGTTSGERVGGDTTTEGAAARGGGSGGGVSTGTGGGGGAAGLSPAVAVSPFPAGAQVGHSE